ncbi:unnamed protein product, partial [Cyprideis torosa]
CLLNGGFLLNSISFPHSNSEITSLLLLERDHSQVANNSPSSMNLNNRQRCISVSLNGSSWMDQPKSTRPYSVCSSDAEGTPAARTLSPYLDVNPAFINSQPEFILMEGASSRRGRFELAFSQIGGSCMTGAALGGVNGFYTGLRDTALAGHTGSVKRTQMLNYVMKRGAGFANTLGVIAVMYSAFGVILQWTRGTDDEINTMVAGTSTGLLYKCSSGLKRCALGGLTGMTLSAAWVLFNSKDRLKQMLS